MKLSIILPIYNVAPYLGRCLDSLINQDIETSDYEIIAINDGSTDNSLDILNQYKQKVANLQILSQDNQGQSVARNNGLKLATGAYVWFADPDDYIEKDCLSYLLETATLHDLDFLGFEYGVDFNGQLKFNKRPQTKYNTLLTSEAFLCNGLTMLPAWFCIIRRQLLIDNKFEFTAGIYHEDVDLLIPFIFACKRLMMSNKICYYYVKRENSSLSNASTTNRKKVSLDFIQVAIRLHNHLSRLTLSKDAKGTIYKRYIENGIRFGIGNIIHREIPTTATEFKENYLKVKQSGILPMNQNGLKVGDRILTFIINNKPLCYFTYYSRILTVIQKIKS